MTATLRHRLGWTLPAIARIVEYGAILLLVGASPWTFALLATIAYHHYDLVYRPRTRGHAPPRWLTLGGWPVRVGVLSAAALLGVVESVAAALTIVLAAAYTGETLVDIRRPRLNDAAAPSTRSRPTTAPVASDTDDEGTTP